MEATSAGTEQKTELKNQQRISANLPMPAGGCCGFGVPTLSPGATTSACCPQAAASQSARLWFGLPQSTLVHQILKLPLAKHYPHGVLLDMAERSFFPSKCYLMGSYSSAFPLVNCMWMCQGWCPILCCSDWHLEICRSLAGWWFLSKYLTAVNTTSTTYLEEKALQK